MPIIEQIVIINYVFSNKKIPSQDKSNVKHLSLLYFKMKIIILGVNIIVYLCLRL